MTKYGVVIEQTTEQTIIDLNEDVSGCASCGLKKVCKPGEKSGEIRLPGSNSRLVPELQAGDKVTVELKERQSIFLSFMLFILPIVIVVILFFVFQSLGWNEAKSIAWALLSVPVIIGLLILMERTLLSGVKVEKVD